MASVWIRADLEMSVTNLPGNYGNGNDNHQPIGWYRTTSDGDWRYRGLIKWNNISSYLPVGAKISSAKVRFKTTNQTYHVSKGSNVRLKISRLTQAFDRTIGSSEFWASSGGTTGFSLSSTTALSYAAEGQHKHSTLYDYDITDFVEDWLPSNYLKRDGSPCDGASNHGIEVKSYDENSSTRSTEFLTERGGYAPYLIIYYTTEADPSKPTITDPGDLVDLLTPPSSVGVDWAAGTGDEGRVFIGTDFLATDVYDSGWGAVTPGGHVDYDVSGATFPVGVPLYIQARSRNDVPVVSADDVHTITVLAVPSATIEHPPAGGRLRVHNLGDLAVWTGGEGKGIVTVGYSHPSGTAAQKMEVRIDGSTIESFDVNTADGGSEDLHLASPLSRGTSHNFEARVQGGGGQWSDWTPVVAASLNWSQVVLPFTPGATSSDFARNHAAVAGGAAVQAAYAYRVAGGNWLANVSSLPAGTTSAEMLVRLSSSDVAANPTLASLEVEWQTSPAPAPDHWEAVNATISLDSQVRRFGVHSMKVVPTGAGTCIVRNDTWAEVSPSTEYTVSCFVNTPEPLSGLVYVGVQRPNGTYLQFANSEAFTDDTGASWLRLWGTFTTEADWESCRPCIIAQSAVTEEFRIDSAQMEVGSVATAWRPGALGPAVVLDAGGINVDAQNGGIFRIQHTGGQVTDVGASRLEVNDVPYATTDDIPVNAQPVRRDYTPGTYTWTRPTPAPIAIVIEAWGGGGSGGGLLASTSNAGSASGGGGGAYVKKLLTGSAIPSSLSLVVAAARPETAAGQNNGQDGIATTVDGTGVDIDANGGLAGESSGTSANQTHAGGRGGNGTGGDVNAGGQTGRPGWVWSGYSVEGGAGGNSGSGHGAPAGGITWHGGNAADVDWGCGGGGAGNSGKSGVNRSGGAGGPGHVTITEYYQ